PVRSWCRQGPVKDGQDWLWASCRVGLPAYGQDGSTRRLWPLLSNVGGSRHPGPDCDQSVQSAPNQEDCSRWTTAWRLAVRRVDWHKPTLWRNAQRHW